MPAGPRSVLASNSNACVQAAFNDGVSTIDPLNSAKLREVYHRIMPLIEQWRRRYSTCLVDDSQPVDEVVDKNL